jgi:release factor glutamine methyltransferase
LLLEAAAAGGDLHQLLERRASGEPLEWVLGWAEFAGVRLSIEAGVFVPRRRTELLAELAIAMLAPGDVVLDLCCGSGAVAVAIGRAAPGVHVLAADIDATSVHCARRNLDPSRAVVYQGDLFAALPARWHGRLRGITANAPYVPSAHIALMPSEARDHEPRRALDGGVDGVELHRRIAADASRWLAPGGWLLIETSVAAVSLTATAVAEAGLSVTVHTDATRDATVVFGM